MGFVAGRVFQDLKNGYHFQVLEEKEYQSALGPVHWSCVLESVGFAPLQPEKRIIEYQGRTIYKAQRDFQENVPVAQNITTSGNNIAWDDGELRFRLTVEEMKKDATNIVPSNSISPAN
jgi:hypothetical protein